MSLSHNEGLKGFFTHPLLLPLLLFFIGFFSHSFFLRVRFRNFERHKTKDIRRKIQKERVDKKKRNKIFKILTRRKKSQHLQNYVTFISRSNRENRRPKTL